MICCSVSVGVRGAIVSGNQRAVAYKAAGPGEHIDGPEQILYPIQPPHN